MNPYDKLLHRKRKWTPVKPTKGKLMEGSEEAIYRALAIRHMELPVGSFITETLGKEVPDTARVLLESNVKDCLLYTSPSPRDQVVSRMPSSA